MKRINVVYEYDFENVVLIDVPDIVAENIDSLVQDFFDWIKKNPTYFADELEDGRMVTTAGADEFVWWLNLRYRTITESATVIKRGTQFNPQYPIADF